MNNELLSHIFSVPVMLATIGGLTLSILNLLEIARLPKERRPDLKDPFYWLVFFTWPILGGLVGFIYYDPVSPPNNIMSFQIGLSSPLILQALAKQAPVVLPKLPEGA